MEREPLRLLPRASHPAVTHDARRGGDRPSRTDPSTTPSTSVEPQRCLPLSLMHPPFAGIHWSTPSPHAHPPTAAARSPSPAAPRWWWHSPGSPASAAPAYSSAAPACTPPAWPYQDPAPPPAAPPTRPRRPLPFPVSLHATEHNDGRPQESTEEQIESDPRAHGNNAQLRQQLPGSNYFTGSPAPRKPDLGERPPPIFPDTRRPHRGPQLFRIAEPWKRRRHGIPRQLHVSLDAKRSEWIAAASTRSACC